MNLLIYVHTHIHTYIRCVCGALLNHVLVRHVTAVHLSCLVGCCHQSKALDRRVHQHMYVHTVCRRRRL